MQYEHNPWENAFILEGRESKEMDVDAVEYFSLTCM